MIKKKVFILFIFLGMILTINHATAQNVVLETDAMCGGFDLRYHTNDGNAVKDIFVRLNMTTLGLETPTREGYKFLGWYYDYNLTIPVVETKAINLSNSYKIYSNASCPAVNIYAKWEKNQTVVNNYQNCNKGFKLRYNYNDGNSYEEVFVRNDGIFGITIPKRSGYNFIGWYYDSALTIPVTTNMEANLLDKYKVKTSDGCLLANIYAKWEKIEEKTTVVTEQTCGGFNLRYHRNDGQAVKEVFVKTNMTTLGLETPTKSGYKFIGWYYDSALTIPVTETKAVNLSNTYKIHANASCPAVNIYAKWEKLEENIQVSCDVKCGGFLLKYNTNGGSLINDVSVSYAMTSLELETPIKDGYTFAGWYYDEALAIPVTETKAVDLLSNYQIKPQCECPYYVLYAKWVKEYKNEQVSISVPELNSENVQNVEIQIYDKSEDIEKFKEYQELSNTKFKAYEIDLYDQFNNKVQPNGFVEITLDIPKYLNRNRLIVYRVDGEKLIPYEVKVINNKAIFETDHFSTYILAEDLTKNVISNSNIFKYIGVGILLTIVIIGLQYTMRYLTKK